MHFFPKILSRPDYEQYGRARQATDQTVQIAGPRSSGRITLTVASSISGLSVFKLTLNLLTTTTVAPSSNASKWQMGFNSAFKGLISVPFLAPRILRFLPDFWKT